MRAFVYRLSYTDLRIPISVGRFPYADDGARSTTVPRPPTAGIAPTAAGTTPAQRTSHRRRRVTRDPAAPTPRYRQ
ncbi:hypothetical protein SGPA1_21018 [Streptomyces misionensis JCM 4497]